MLLTTKEYNCQLNDFLKELACSAHNDMVNHIWLTTRKHIPHKNMRLLWLFTFALDNYVHGATDNYITERQAIAILSKANSFL